MTKAEIEKEAREYVERKRYRFEGNEYEGDIADGLHDAYIAGAKDNAVTWHDLRKNPDDLPANSLNIHGGIDTHTSIQVLSNRNGIVYYDFDIKGWFANGYPLQINSVIAWCKIPKFEEA